MNSTTDFTVTQLYSTASYQAGDLTDIRLRENDLTGGDFSGQNLTNVDFYRATLTNADFTNAEVTEVNFYATTALGFTSSQLYSTASYQTGDLTGIILSYNDLTGWDFAGQDLTNASFASATLDNTDFTNAKIRGANFQSTTDSGFTSSQLYSTVSYQAGDLTHINLGFNDLTGWNFSEFNLTNSDFLQANLPMANLGGANLTNSNFHNAVLTAADLSGANLYRANLSGAALTGANLSGANLCRAELFHTTLTGADLSGAKLTYAFFIRATLNGADFSGADARAAFEMNTSTAVTHNFIHPDGHIEGLQITASEVMRLWDFNHLTLIPIHVEDTMSVDPTGTLRAVFEDDNWGSTISFDPGISVSLDGTLELLISPDEETNITSLIGTTFDLFDWTGVTPSGTFAQITTLDGLVWDTSSLYTTGDVTLLEVPGYLFADFDDDGVADGNDFLAWQRGFGITSGATGADGDADGDGDVDRADLKIWQTRVGTAIVTVPGDFDFDGDVDGADFLKWQRGFGSVYNASDLADWRANFGNGASLPATSAAVPEPSSLLLVVVGLLGLGTTQRRRRW